MPMLTTARIRLPGVADPLARAHALAERGHPVEHLVHLAHDVDAVDDERALARHAQRDVQHRAVLGDVDVLAAEHRVAALGDLACAGEPHEQRHRLVGHPVLRPVGVPASRLAAQPPPRSGSLANSSRRWTSRMLAVVRLERLERREARAARRHAGFSRWPPNAKRIAERVRFAKSSSPRELKRENRAVASTGMGVPVSFAASSVQRPSPESETRPENFSSVGSSWRACAVRSSSHEATTLPAAPDLGDLGEIERVLVALGVAERRRLGVDRVVGEARRRRASARSGPRRRRP